MQIHYYFTEHNSALLSQEKKQVPVQEMNSYPGVTS